MSQVPNPQMPPAGGPPKKRKTGPAGNVTLVLVAIGLGLFTVFLNMIYINQIKAENERRVKVVYRLVKPLEVGHQLKERDVRRFHIPEDYADSLSASAVVVDNPDDALNLNTQVGKRIMQPVRENEFLTYEMFEDTGGINPGDIPEGYKAVPIPVDPRGGVAALLRPQMEVDIVATIPQPGKLPQTMLVIEKVKVLAVGRTTATSDRMSSSYSSITVALPPKESLQMVAIAKAVGKDGFNILVRERTDVVTKFAGKVNPDVLKLLRIES